MAPRTRFAILDCEDADKWDGHAIAISRLFSRAGERWRVLPASSPRVLRFDSASFASVRPSPRNLTPTSTPPSPSVSPLVVVRRPSSFDQGTLPVLQRRAPGARVALLLRRARRHRIASRRQRRPRLDRRASFVPRRGVRSLARRARARRVLRVPDPRAGARRRRGEEPARRRRVYAEARARDVPSRDARARRLPIGRGVVSVVERGFRFCHHDRVRIPRRRGDVAPALRDDARDVRHGAARDLEPRRQRPRVAGAPRAQRRRHRREDRPARLVVVRTTARRRRVLFFTLVPVRPRSFARWTSFLTKDFASRRSFLSAHHPTLSIPTHRDASQLRF